MSFEEFLAYSARLGEIKDVEEMLAVRDPPVDVNFKDESASSNTALHMASANGHTEIVKLLLKVPGIKVSELNVYKNTPLHYAALNGHVDIVNLLIEAKADPNVVNDFDRIPLDEALQSGNTQIADILSEYAP